MESVVKRARVLQACDACRTSKLRCSGESSCMNCERRLLTCLYSGVALPPSTDTTASDLVRSLQDENSALKARVAALEASARVISPSQTACSSASSSGVSSPPAEIPSRLKHPDLSLSEAIVMYSPPPLTEKVANFAVSCSKYSLRVVL